MSTTVHGRPAAPILGALLLAALAFALSQTMVAPALPAIRDQYGATTTSASWVLTAYLLSASICTPIVGKLGDLHGKGRVLTIVLTIFCVGSIVCALTSSISVLIVGRLICGVAGGVFPLAFGIINDELPAERRGSAIGLVSAMFGIGGGIGLPLAGVIVDNIDISWLFWIGLIAAPAAAASWFLVPASPPRERTGVDWGGAAILSTGLAAVLFSITRANTWGFGDPRTVGMFLTGLLVLVAFGAYELRHPHPLVDMRVLRERPVLFTNITAVLVGVGMYGSFLLIPQFAQAPDDAGYGFAFSVTQAGLLMLPSSAVMLIGGPLGGVLGARLGFRRVLAIGCTSLAASFAVLIAAHGAPWHFVLSGVLLGFGISFAFASMANLIVAAVPREDVGIATGINTVARTVGGALGSAIVAALLAAETIGGTNVPTEAAYTDAFIISTVGSLLALAATITIPKLRPPASADASAAPADVPAGASPA